MYRGIAENAFLSKWAGGLGGSWTSVRGTGSHITGTNKEGCYPFLKCTTTNMCRQSRQEKGIWLCLLDVVGLVNFLN